MYSLPIPQCRIVEQSLEWTNTKRKAKHFYLWTETLLSSESYSTFNEHQGTFIIYHFMRVCVCVCLCVCVSVCVYDCLWQIFTAKNHNLYFTSPWHYQSGLQVTTSKILHFSVIIKIRHPKIITNMPFSSSLARPLTLDNNTSTNR